MPWLNKIKLILLFLNLKKFNVGFFGQSEKTVVDSMSLNFYENQITGLLGHNGAGKVKLKSLL